MFGRKTTALLAPAIVRAGSFLLVAALLLASCGGRASPTAAPTSKPVATQPPPPTTAPPTTAPPTKVIKVTMTNAPDENDKLAVERQKQLEEAFKTRRPDVVIEAHQGGWNKEAFAAKFAGGTMEDAFLVPITEPQDLIAKGYAADITDLIKAWEHFASFNPTVLKIVQDAKGRIYGIPVSGFAQGLIYNRKLFKEAGLDPDKPPTTWDQVREYARKLTDPAKGRAGFVECSKSNQGGWHLVAWIYSYGGDVEVQKDGKWVAAFNNEAALKSLQMLKAMRWEDKSLTEQMLDVAGVLPLLATERVAMSIMAPDALRSLKTQYQANIEDFGFGPLPQGGGNATYAGGNFWMFNSKSSPEVLKAAVEWTLFHSSDLATYDADLKAQRDRGQLVGYPDLPVYTGEFARQRAAIVAKHANAPVQYYKPYLEALEGRLQLRAAPPVEAQKLFALLDTVLQAILTDTKADPKKLLDEAAQQFQTQVLDPLNK